MRFLSIALLVAASFLAGCSTTDNTNKAGNANLRGANTNTGYVTDSNANVKPTIPANATNIEPPSMNTNSNSNRNGNMNANANANRANRP